MGLTNYFPGSFLDRAVLGTIAAQHLASESPNSSRKPYQRDLSNNQPVTKLVFANVQEAYPFVDAWGGIFWEIRTKLGKVNSDKLIYNAWRLLADQDDSTVGRSFAVNLLSQARARAGADGEVTVSEILLRRGLDLSHLPSSTGSR